MGDLLAAALLTVYGLTAAAVFYFFFLSSLCSSSLIEYSFIICGLYPYAGTTNVGDCY